MPAPRWTFALLLALVAGPVGCGGPPPVGIEAGEEEPDCCKVEGVPVESPSTGDSLALDPISIPEVRLQDQAGRPVDSMAGLIGDRVAAIQFVFTRCSTTCPILGGQFQGVQDLLRGRLGPEFALISVTVDPDYDLAPRMAAWGERFGAGAGWSLLTGPKPEVDRMLKGLGTFSGDKQSHQSQVLIVDGATGRGTRASGLASPAEMAKLMRRVRDARPPRVAPSPKKEAEAPPASASSRYFPDAVLVDQDGKPVRFYTDLLEGRVVVINVFFAACTGSCVVMGDNMAKIQERLGDRLGKDVQLISITVDREHDTPEALADYARKQGARPGWSFLTGDKENVDLVLRKLGQHVERREDHGNLFLVGNLKTGLWKKAFGLGKSQDLIALVETVLDDRGN